jgi:epoxyqueuosine reductase
MDTNQIKELFLKEGFLTSSVASIKKPVSFSIYKAQINSGNTGGMTFLKEHMELKSKPKGSYKSALIGLYPYYPFEDDLKSSLRVSVYAKSKDYHLVLKEKLDSIVFELKRSFPEEEFLSAVDSMPVLEKDLAFKAGLGWIGKNTCLLNKDHGSLFFVAEILTSLDLESLKQKKAPLQTDHCGTCTRCIEVCPTEALTPHKLEVEKCISYRTIEKKDSSKEVLKSPLHSWFFGCDLCQTVCPWNEKVFGKDQMRSLEEWEVTDQQIFELEEILKSSNKSLDKKYKDFPLSRPRGKRLKRNALQVIYENKISKLKNLLKQTDLGDLNELKNEVIKVL